MDDFLASGRGEGDQFPQLEFEQLPFNHPLFIMYSSGTTGAPKCMVHSTGVRNTMACTCSELKVFSLNTQIHSIFHIHKHKHTADNYIIKKITMPSLIKAHGLLCMLVCPCIT